MEETAQATAKEKFERDHEFPWILLYWVGAKIVCERCKAEDEIGNWLPFLYKHGECKEQ